MSMPPEFEAEALYESDQWYLHEIEEIDHENHRIVALMHTTELGPLVAAQRPWPGQPKHVPGTAIIQATGTLGNLHAVLTLGIKMSEGWVGYGVALLKARYGKPGRIGPPVRCTMEVVKLKKLRGTYFVHYRFLFEQDGERVYESEQTAAWSKPDPDEIEKMMGG